MTNKELMEQLAKLPPEARVEVYDLVDKGSYLVEDVISMSGEVSIGFRELA